MFETFEAANVVLKNPPDGCETQRSAAATQNACDGVGLVYPPAFSLSTLALRLPSRPLSLCARHLNTNAPPPPLRSPHTRLHLLHQSAAVCLPTAATLVMMSLRLRPGHVDVELMLLLLRRLLQRLLGESPLETHIQQPILSIYAALASRGRSPVSAGAC